MIEIEICEAIDRIPIVSSAVQGRIMHMDFRAAEWKNPVNYKEEPITVMQTGGYILPSVVVDMTGTRRSLVLRGAGRYMDGGDIWLYTPRGLAGRRLIRNMMQAIEDSLHQLSLPSNPKMMHANSNGPYDDGRNLFTVISFDITRVMADVPEPYRGQENDDDQQP